MEVAEEQTELRPEDLLGLQEAFAHFCERTSQLEQAYRRLKEEAERVNLELEAANRQLEDKVRQLDEVNNLQRSILESIPTAVVVTDLCGTINTFNPAAEAMWRVPQGWAIGRNFREVMGTQHRLLSDALSGRPRAEALRRALDGQEPMIVSSSACLVADSDGRPIGAIQVDQDVTRLCALESRLHQQEKLADLGKMAAGLAHEIRKPLNGIKGFASILERTLDCDAAEARYISNITGAADRLSGMLGRLLNFAKPDQPRMVPCDLRAQAEQVAEFVRAEDPESTAVISVDIPEEARPVLADAGKCKQVLLNLVKNGVDALEGPGEVRVTASLERSDGIRRVRVAVSDTGRGISQEALSQITEPFYSDKEGGTGLGLAIVDRMLQLHGTQLEATSRPGQGTCMTFALPAATNLEAG